LIPIRDHLATRTFPFVNYALIAANVVVFVLELAGAVDMRLSFLPARLLVDPAVGVETVFTSMFMHAGFAHIGGNMLFLWIFGDNVEDAMGHVRYLVFYLLGGVCAAAAQGLAAPTLPLLGASGAISAVLAAYAFLYPSSPVDVINPVPILWLFYGFLLRLPAWLVIAAFFAVNLWSVLVGAGGGVAFMAHVGGFVAGVVMLRPFMSGRERMDEYARHERWARRRGQPGW
jgi:membrane associated rhomboid family serine protease